MRKIIGLSIIGTAALALAAQSGGLLAGFVKALNGAEGLKATYQAGSVNGTMANFDITLAKPDKARIETPISIIIADGKTILTYDKQAKTYYRDPQIPGALAALFQDEAVALWAPFFDSHALDRAATKSLGTKTRKGEQFNVVEATFSGGKRKVNYYLDAAGLAKQAEITYSDSNDQKVVVTKSLALGSANDSAFTFNAPAGSRELSEEERYSDKWLHNLDEALALAKRTNRLVMVDFDATWCGPCQKMKAEVYPMAEFKAFGKQFVFCEIDVDENPSLAKKYEASSIPLVKFMTPDGSVFHKFVGYANPDQVLGEMKKALQIAGR